MSFYYDTEIIEGKKSYLLGYRREKEDEHNLLIKVSPELGNNLYCFRIDGYEVVHYDSYFSLLSYYTGNPILYPFPNRLRNCFYTFEGKNYWHQKNGIPVFLHSLVYDEAWSSEEPYVSEDVAILRTWLDIGPDHPVYEGFPFAHRLIIEFAINRMGFRISYKVENNSADTLPFGISFHTFFKKLCGDKGSYIRVPARYLMELTEDLLPTGKLIDVEGRDFDLRTPVPAGNLDLDNCFTGMIPGERVYIDYPALGLRVYMDSSEEFTHMQVFTPKEKPFFCVEKQTCSTDSVNLDNRGFSEEAHLLRVAPGGVMSGHVDFSFELKDR